MFSSSLSFACWFHSIIFFPVCLLRKFFGFCCYGFYYGFSVVVDFLQGGCGFHCGSRFAVIFFGGFFENKNPVPSKQGKTRPILQKNITAKKNTAENITAQKNTIVQKKTTLLGFFNLDFVGGFWFYYYEFG